jgi:general secretion pathway protein G
MMIKNRRKSTRKNGFSLIELVIVIVIIGLISAIAVPRLTRGASNAGSAALKGSLAQMRSAIELYRAEHEGSFPTVANFESQMTQFSDLAGTSFNASADIASGKIYGPYLQAIPQLPVGAKKGLTGVAAADGVGVGWIYSDTTGALSANTTLTEKDQDGDAYSSY